MKKALIVMAILTTLSLAGVITFVVLVFAQNESIVLTEEVEFGDKKIIDGVKATLKFRYDTKCYWTVEYYPGENPVTKTEYSYEAIPEKNHTNFHGDGRKTEGAIEFAEKLAVVCGIDKSEQKAISVSEVANTIYCYYDVNGYAEQLMLTTEFVEDTCYFLVEYKPYQNDSEKEVLGIYTFDIIPSTGNVDIDSIQNIYTARMGVKVTDFFVDEANNNLWFFENARHQNYKVIYDLDTMKGISRASVGTRQIANHWQYEDFIVLSYYFDDAIVVYTIDETGSYVKALDVEYDKLTKKADAFDWDGERLIYVSPIADSCGVSIMVFEQEGMVFYATYANSVDRSDLDCSWIANPLNISWN